MTRERTTTNLVYTLPESRHDHNGPHLVANWFVRSLAHPSSSCSFVRSFLLFGWSSSFFFFLHSAFRPSFGTDGRTALRSFVRSALPPSRFVPARSPFRWFVRSSLPRCLTQHFQGRLGKLVFTFWVYLRGCNIL